jgi:TRAP-type mannitol/chloroaromatic compound transport system permease small subunit
MGLHSPAMGVLLKLAESISAANRTVARAVSWLTLAMVLLTFAIAFARYLFGWGSIALQEAVIYMHAAVFMGAAAAGLALDSHVRVDIFYSKWPAARKAWVNRLGHLLLLLPFTLFLLAASWNYVGDAWRLREASSDPGGLPWLYLLKTLILVMGVQLALQAIAGALRPAPSEDTR